MNSIIFQKIPQFPKSNQNRKDKGERKKNQRQKKKGRRKKNDQKKNKLPLK